MRPSFIQKLQKESIFLLKSSSSNKSLSLQELSQDNCSEITRLLGCWFLNKYPASTVAVLKGNMVMGSRKAHDILSVTYSDSHYLIDPTIWQFFPRKKSIFVGKASSLITCLHILKKVYGGSWQVSENVTKSKCTIKNIRTLRSILKNNYLS